MKKLLLFVIMCTLGLFGTVRAQETITIGDEANASHACLPFDLYNGWGVSQQLFTADEIGKSAGEIQSFGLKFVGPTNSDMYTVVDQDPVKVDFQIYVQNTTMTELSSYQVVNTEDLYYEGDDDVLNNDAWTTFEFSKSFEYTGNSLLVTIYCVGWENTSNNYYPFYIFSTEKMQCYSTSPTSKPEAGEFISSMSESTGKNIIQLGFAAGEGGEEPTPEQPGEESGEVVTIGDITTNTTSNMIPIYTYYSKSISQQYYLKEEIGENEGTITSVAFHTATGDFPCERTISIYMKNTDESSFADKYMIAMEENDLVFNGSVEFASDQWVTIELTNEFNYTGSNILLCVYDQTGQYNDGIDFNTFADNNGTRTKYQSGNASSDFSPIGTQISAKTIYSVPCVQFTFAGEGGEGGETPEEPTEPVAPAIPTNVVATANGQNSIVVTWDAVEGATDYYVYKGGQMWANTSGATTYTEKNLAAGTECCFAIQAVNGTLESALSEEVCATTEAAPVAPEIPTNVVATANGFNSIVVTWDAVEGATNYYVYKGGQMWADTQGATTYTENGLEMGTEYCYAVKAVAALESELSEEVCATTESLPENQILVGAPADKYLTPFVTALGNAWVEMIYKADEIGKAGKIAEIAYSYNSGAEVTADIEIYFAEITKSVFGSVADVTPTTDLKLVYSGTGVTLCDSAWETFVLDTPFDYSGENNLLVVVTTSNTSGQNNWNCYSDANTVLVKGTLLFDKKPVMMLTLAPAPVAPNAPANLAATATETTVKLTWEAVENATSYNVYQGEELVANVTKLTYTFEGLTAETEYTFSVTAVGELELESEPATVTVTTEAAPAPVAKAYRLESEATSYMATEYVYDEELTNRVIAVVEEELVTKVTYNEEGQILRAAASYEDVDEDGNPVEEVFSSVDYTYDENGVWVGYKEFFQSWFGPAESEVVLGYDAEGRLVSLTSEEQVQTVEYNEAGLISEVVTSQAVEEEEDEDEDIEDEEDIEQYPDGGEVEVLEEETEEVSMAFTDKMTFEYDAEGRLVKKSIYEYDNYELKDFYLSEVEVYEYDENGNCATKKVYLAEDEELNSFPFSVTEYFYDLEINNEDVYRFEYPHFAFEFGWVEPSYVNILTKEFSYMSYYDDELEEIVSHSYEAVIYNYNPEVLSSPLTPMNLSAEALSSSSVELTWAGFADAESFVIYSADTVVAKVEEPYYTIEGLEMDVEYCFAVQAVNAEGKSEVSETVCITIELPAAPTNLVAEATSDTTISLTWEAVPGIWEYNVYEVVEVEGETTYEFVANVYWNSHEIEGLEAETEYSYVVTAVSTIGESAYSDVAKATTLAAEEEEGIEENATALNIYPNPAVDRLVIETEATVESVSIYTLTGVMIYNEQCTMNNVQLNVSDFNGGVYFIRVVTNEGETVQRFIKK